MRPVFEGQLGHAIALTALLVGVIACVDRYEVLRVGAWLGVGTPVWLFLSLLVPVLHQLWVVAWWRTELHFGLPSRLLGRATFPVYATGFAILGLSRLPALAAVGAANVGTLPITAPVASTVSIVMLLPVVWLMRSIRAYFGFAHAMGADHFFEEHRTRGLCREGIFRFIPNAMYTVGFLALWAIAVSFRSAAATLVAAFSHAYIWVHYFATEAPDMRRIYSSS